MKKTGHCKAHPTVSEAHPSWLPVDGPPWRLVDYLGTFLRDADGHSIRFHTDEEALEYLSKKGIPLMNPKW